MRRITHNTIKKVTEDISNRFNFNTAISAIMEMVNALYQYKEIPETDLQPCRIKGIPGHPAAPAGTLCPSYHRRNLGGYGS